MNVYTHTHTYTILKHYCRINIITYSCVHGQFLLENLGSLLSSERIDSYQELIMNFRDCRMGRLIDMIFAIMFKELNLLFGCSFFQLQRSP